MIQVRTDFPKPTGDSVADMARLYDYLYKLERELRHIISVQEKKIKELEERE